MALVGLGEMTRGRDAVGRGHGQRQVARAADPGARLGILGTLGNNAPFIGLFGTVLGIIKAFADLAKNQGAAGRPVVMRGISEALVATAVGLLVAIPAVIAYNIFQGRVRRTMRRIDTMAHLILSAAPSRPPAVAPAARG